MFKIKAIDTQCERISLREKLVSDGRLRWLDIGCGGNFEEGFDYIDVFPPGAIPAEVRERYYQIDVLHDAGREMTKLGLYDLVRLQHTFEHFSFEDGQIVLRQCASVLRPGGLVLITTPDLRVHISQYLGGRYKDWDGFKWWAHKRIPPDAPASYYFSVFAYSMPFEAHRWCYDSEGLGYQLSTSQLFEDIHEVKVGDSLWSYPFTHNRPDEDVCIIARRKL